MNLVLDDVDEQKEAIQAIAKDDIVAKMNSKTLDWIQACATGILSTAQAMHRTSMHSIDTRQSQLGSQYGDQAIYNGFCGMHYAIVNGHYDIVQLLFDYEFCDTTRARVLMRAPGIGANKLVVVPIGTNCLQLAALAGQKEILALLIDEVVKRNTARLIDPIQSSFGKKPPLSVKDKLKIFTMKNELDQGLLHTLATCRAFFDEESVAAICLELQTKEVSKEQQAAQQIIANTMKANTGINKKEVEPEKIDMANNQALQILDHRIDLVFKLAALFTNAKLIRMVR